MAGRRPLILLLSAGIAAGCGGSPTSPSGKPLSETIETPGIVFHYATGDVVDAAWQQTYDEWATAALQVQPTRRVVYNKYMNRTQMGDLTGQYTANGFADPSSFAIHTIWPRDNHEVVHLFSSLFGNPVALFNEGLAVAFEIDPVAGDFIARWNSTPVHDLARSFRQSGRLIPLDTLVATSGFRQQDDTVTYPEAGSFMRYLLDTYGLDALKRLFQPGNPNDAAAVVKAQFQSVYGRSLNDIERDWWAMLDAR